MKSFLGCLGAVLVLLLIQGTASAQPGRIKILKQTKESFHFEYVPEEKLKKMFAAKIVVMADLVENELVSVDYN